MSGDNQNCIVVKLEKTTNIRNISSLFSDVISAFSSGRSVEIDVADAVEVDLSFVQLVESARLHAGANGKSLSMSRPASRVLLDVLERGGFIETASEEDALFWLHKETAL